MTQRLIEGFGRPITAPGSEARAALVFSTLGGEADVAGLFAKKALQTLDDGEMHTAVLSLPGNEPLFVVAFAAWNGSHREIQAERVGRYLSTLFATARRCVEWGLNPAGFLEVAAYVRMAGKQLVVDVEYSYLVGSAFGSSAPLPKEPLLRAIQINPTLCTAEERKMLGLVGDPD
jgi:hypothetical protein